MGLASGVTTAPTRNVRRAVQLVARQVRAAVERGDRLEDLHRVEVEDRLGLRVVAHDDVVAREREHRCRSRTTPRRAGRTGCRCGCGRGRSPAAPGSKPACLRWMHAASVDSRMTAAWLSVTLSAWTRLAHASRRSSHHLGDVDALGRADLGGDHELAAGERVSEAHFAPPRSWRVHVPLARLRVDRVVLRCRRVVELLAAALRLEAVVDLHPRAVAVAQLAAAVLHAAARAVHDALRAARDGADAGGLAQHALAARRALGLPARRAPSPRR